MRITDKKYFDKYLIQIGNEIPDLIKKYDFSESRGGFDYLTKASAVYSSNIEGNSIDLNSFMNYEFSKDKFKIGKEIEEIENLITAYEFAQKNKLTETNLLTCHKVLSETLLIKSKRGKYRIEPVGVFGKSAKICRAFSLIKFLASRSSQNSPITTFLPAFRAGKCCSRNWLTFLVVRFSGWILYSP